MDMTSPPSTFNPKSTCGCKENHVNLAKQATFKSTLSHSCVKYRDVATFSINETTTIPKQGKVGRRGFRATRTIAKNWRSTSCNGKTFQYSEVKMLKLCVYGTKEWYSFSLLVFHSLTVSVLLT